MPEYYNCYLYHTTVMLLFPVGTHIINYSKLNNLIKLKIKFYAIIFLFPINGFQTSSFYKIDCLSLDWYGNKIESQMLFHKKLLSIYKIC